ncbi:MAG: glycosyltransferase [Candidatus Taylorbacteria bacterium]|nr:glycosyltransferase [Candidatus Taylorbacteria bacterium]
MRYVHILNGITSEISGGDQHALRLMSTQVKEGAQVSVISSSILEDLSKPQYVTFDVYRESTPVPYGVRLFLRYIYRTCLSVLKVRQYKKDDVFIASSHFFFDVLPLFFTPSKKRYCYVHHIVSTQGRKGITKIYHAVFERISFFILKILNVGIVSVSQVITEVLVGQFNFSRELIFQSSNGIDEKYTDSLNVETGSSNDIVYCGRMHRSKGIYTFVDTIIMLRKRGFDITAALLGSGPELKNLKAYIESRGMSPHINVPGYVSDEEKIGVYQKSKVFFSASTEEGWGIAMGEALATGLPVVSFSNQEMKRVWGEAICFVGDNTIDAAVEVILRILDGRQKRDEDAVREVLKKYDWDIVLQREHDFLSEEKTVRDILVLGSYGRGNIGDDVFLYAIRKHIDERRIYINCADTSLLPDDLHGVFRTIDTHFFRHWIHKIHVFFGLKYIIYAGGDVWTLMFEDRIKRKHLYKMLCVNLVARICGKKVIYLGTGVGDLDSLSVFLSRMTCLFTSYVVFRDQESARKLHLSRNVYSVLPDLASQLKIEGAISRKKQIAFSLLYFVPNPKKNYTHIRDAYISLAHEYIQKGYDIVLVPFLKTSEVVEDDLWVAKDIMKYIPKEYMHHIRICTDHSIFGVTQVFKESILVVASRLHASILSVLSETPVIAISYRGKVSRAMADMGLSQFVLNIDDINKLSTTVSYILDTYPDALQRVSEAKKHVIEYGKNYKAIIDKHIS